MSPPFMVMRRVGTAVSAAGGHRLVFKQRPVVCDGLNSLPESSGVFLYFFVVFDQVLSLVRLALADLGTVVSPDIRGFEPQWSSKVFD